MAEDEYFLKSQITALVYTLLEKKPDIFTKVSEDVVTCFLERSNLALSLDLKQRNFLSGMLFKIQREELNNIWYYKLYCSIIVNNSTIHIVTISELDYKTAYKFFQTERQTQIELENLKQIRDTLLKDIE